MTNFENVRKWPKHAIHFRKEKKADPYGTGLKVLGEDA